MLLSDCDKRNVQGGGFSMLCPRCLKKRIYVSPAWTWYDDSLKPSINANPDHAHFEITEGKIVFSKDDKATCDGV